VDDIVSEKLLVKVKISTICASMSLRRSVNHDECMSLLALRSAMRCKELLLIALHSFYESLDLFLLDNRFQGRVNALPFAVFACTND